MELRNIATSDTYKAVSQADGSFQFNNLIPGTYEITVTAAGFKTYVQQNLALQAQIAGTVNVVSPSAERRKKSK